MSQEKLTELRDEFVGILERCILCPRKCKVNRLEDKRGFCKTGRLAVVCGFQRHFGEEKELVGIRGSGTVFFSFCNLRCVFCQNYDISQLGNGKEMSANEIADGMLWLQSQGAHNINLVTPTHVIPQILEALVIARKKGLRLPLVYNSGGYDDPEIIRKLEGIFDIYMPDAKYSLDENAIRYSAASNYWNICKKNLIEMNRQVGVLKTDKRGIATRGLIIRHLVLPNGLAGSKEVIDFIAENLPPDTYLNIMAQYFPTYKAQEYQELSTRVSLREYIELIRYARERGLKRVCAEQVSLL